MDLLIELNKIKHLEHIGTCFSHSKHSINVFLLYSIERNFGYIYTQYVEVSCLNILWSIQGNRIYHTIRINIQSKYTNELKNKDSRYKSDKHLIYIQSTVLIQH